MAVLYFEWPLIGNFWTTGKTVTNREVIFLNLQKPEYYDAFATAHAFLQFFHNKFLISGIWAKQQKKVLDICVAGNVLLQTKLVNV